MQGASIANGRSILMEQLRLSWHHREAKAAQEADLDAIVETLAQSHPDHFAHEATVMHLGYAVGFGVSTYLIAFWEPTGLAIGLLFGLLIASALARGAIAPRVLLWQGACALMGFITSPEGELQGDDVMDGERVQDFSPGVFRYLAPGESVTVPDLHAPDGQFEPFMRAMLRAVSAGLGVSYESVSHDFSSTNYSSSRLSLLEERDTYRQLQAWMIENFHQRVFEAWLDMAVLSGALDLPMYDMDPDRYREVRWMPRGWAWVDPQKEVDAYKAAEMAEIGRAHV